MTLPSPQVGPFHAADPSDPSAPTEPVPTPVKAQPVGRQTLRIADLLLDRRFQAREKLDPAGIQRYVDALSADGVFPPIEVALLNGVLVVCDGWHRIEASKRAGIAEIEAEVFAATEREAAGRAAVANLKHGVPLKTGDMRRVFRLYVRAGQHRRADRSFKPYREIARDLNGCRSHVTISTWMHKDFPSVARAMGGGEPVNKGDPGARHADPDGGFKHTAREALGQAMVAFGGLGNPHHRGEVIFEAQAIVDRMKAAGPWEEPNEATMF